jgi:hypothetical protein
MPKIAMKTNVLSAFSFCLLLSVSAYAQHNTTTEQEARRQTRAQKIEKSKTELKEIGQDVKEKAKVVGEVVSTEAQKAAEAIERKAEERKAKRGTARRDTV